MTASNTYGRQVVVPLVNKSGGGVIAGDVVVIASANSDSFTTTTSANSTAIVGVAQDTIANNATGRICLGGYVPLVNVNASCTVLHYGATFTVAKQATDVGTSRAAGTCMVFLTTSTTPDAFLYNPDLGGASLTNPMTTAGDIIVGGGSGVPARLADVATGSVLASGGVGVAPAWSTLGQSSNAIVATSQTLTGNNSWVDLATVGPTVTITVNTKCLIILTSHISGGTGGYGDMGFAASSANTIAAGTANKAVRASGPTSGWDMILSATFMLTGLAPGSTVFTAKYNQQGGGGTTAWSNREIIVILLD